MARFARDPDGAHLALLRQSERAGAERMTQIRWQPETTTTTHVVLEVNGERHSLDVPGDRRLVDVLRDDLGLTGTKHACGEGACGACAVLIDGEPVASCIYPVAKAEGHTIQTIEGISAEGLTALQEAFVAEDALQCGFCTPGQIVSATALLAENP